jgi:hypothetical protein
LQKHSVVPPKTPRPRVNSMRSLPAKYDPDPVEVLAFKLLHQTLVPAPPPFHSAHKFRYRKAIDRASDDLTHALGQM